jgi:hypothetical protein
VPITEGLRPVKDFKRTNDGMELHPWQFGGGGFVGGLGFGKMGAASGHI